MSQSTLYRWLKGIILLVGACGLAAYCWLLPQIARWILADAPEFQYCFIPWMVFMGLSALPCFAVLILSWRIARNIGEDRSFSMQNARLLQGISILAAADAGLFFCGNILFLLLNMNHPGIVLAALGVVFFGIAVSVCTAGLSHLVQKAAVLQEQSDLTV